MTIFGSFGTFISGSNVKGLDDTIIDFNDRATLESFGYKQELNRELNLFMNFSFGFSEVSVIASLSAILTYGLMTGGPVIIIWGWIITFIFTLIVVLCLAEICSAYPTAGGVYSWSGMLVPIKSSTIAAYICGWSNFIGNAAGDATFAYAFSDFLNAAINIQGGRNMTKYEIVGLSIGINLLWTILSCFDIGYIGRVNSLAAILQIIAVAVVFYILLSNSHSINSFDYVFTYYYNDSGWSSPVYVAAIGLLTSLFSFSAYDASGHLAEETSNARVNAPLAMIYTVITTGFVGLVYLLGLLFVFTMSEALHGTTTVASINIFMSITGKLYGSVLSWLIVGTLFLAGLSSVAITGRITYAMMRDGVFPHGKYWSEVHEISKSPYRCLLFAFIFNVFLLLLPLISQVAFNSIAGICIIGFNISYAIPLLMKLYYKYDSFPPTPINLGKYTNYCNIIAVSWLIITSIILLLPTRYPITINNMNWSIVILCGISIVLTIYWFVYAKDNYLGPSRPNLNRNINNSQTRLIH